MVSKEGKGLLVGGDGKEKRDLIGSEGKGHGINRGGDVQGTT